MQCDDVLAKLELLVYDELPADQSAALREHILQCESCRKQFESLAQARAALDEWKSVKPDVAVSAVLESIETSDALHVVTTIGPGNPAANVSTGGRKRILPWLMGAAAGLALAITVLSLGAQVRSTDGQLVISFGRSAPETVPAQNNNQTQPVASPAELSDEQLNMLVTMLGEHVDRRTAESLRLVRDQFREMKGEQDQRFLALVRTLSEMRSEDLERFEQALMQVMAESQQTKAALQNVVAALPSEPNNLLNGPLTPGRKEIVP